MRMRHFCKKKQARTTRPTRATLYAAIVTFSISTCLVSAFLLWTSTSNLSRKGPIKMKKHWVKSGAAQEAMITLTLFDRSELPANEDLKVEDKIKEKQHENHTLADNKSNENEGFLARALNANLICANVSSQTDENFNDNDSPSSSDMGERYNKRYMKWKFINSHTVERKTRYLNYKLKKRLLLYSHHEPKNKWIHYRRDFNNELEDTEEYNNNGFEVNVENVQEFLTDEVPPSRATVIKWCPIFKAASSPWMAIFTTLRGALTPLTEKKIHEGKLSFLKLVKDFRINVPIVGRSNSQTQQVQSYSMVVVRHPFERILSAYRDKIERTQGRQYYYRKYSSSIIRRFRKPTGSAGLFNFNLLTQREDLPLQHERILPSQTVVEDGNTTPPEQHPMLKRLRVNGHGLVNLEHFPSGRGHAHTTDLKEVLPVPTFDEFVQYLLSMQPSKMDEHWRPMYIDCSPCWNHFDFILKVETITEDRDKILRLLGYDKRSKKYQELIAAWKRWQNKVTPSLINANKSTHSYFSQLTKSRLKKLYDIYEYDFKLFNYSAEPYFKMAS